MAQKFAGFPIYEMQSGTRGAADALVMPLLIFRFLFSSEIGLHVQARFWTTEYDQAVHRAKSPPEKSSG
jgi:hypothetical protein